MSNKSNESREIQATKSEGKATVNEADDEINQDAIFPVTEGDDNSDENVLASDDHNKGIFV